MSGIIYYYKRERLYILLTSVFPNAVIFYRLESDTANYISRKCNENTHY